MDSGRRDEEERASFATFTANLPQQPLESPPGAPGCPGAGASGAMDNAPDYASGDCRFDSCLAQPFPHASRAAVDSVAMVLCFFLGGNHCLLLLPALR